MSVPDVLCIGSATIDHFLTINIPFSQLHLGDKVLVAAKETHSGGGATNAAAAVSKLGLKAQMLTKLGPDPEARFILEEMSGYNVKNLCRHHSPKSTDFSTIISSTKETDRLILVHKGASQDLKSRDFHKRQLQAKWIYLASLTGNSITAGKEIARFAREHRIPLLFNPSLYLASTGRKFLQPLLKAARIIVLNTEEAQALAQSHSGQMDRLLSAIQKLGPETIIITQGAKNVYARHRQKTYWLVPPKVKVVHTAGAGDAFTAGVLAGIIKKYSFEDALRLGQVNALSVIQHIGTKNKLLHEREAKELMKKFQIKVHSHAC